MRSKIALTLAAILATGTLSACLETTEPVVTGTTYEYMVSYYFQTNEGDFELGRMESKKITTSETEYSVRIPNYEGYTFDEDNAGNVTTLTLSSGMNAYSLYYNVAEYEVKAILDDGTVWSTQNVSYGKKASEPATPKKKDHVLLEWRVQDGAVYSFDSQVKKDLVLVPEWVENTEAATTNDYVAATWYFTDEENKEHKLILSADGKIDVMTNEKSDGYGTYFYGQDGFVELNIAAGSKAGEYVCEIDGLHMVFCGNDYTKNGYIINDFVDASELSVVSSSIPQDPWGWQKDAATLSWIDEKTANSLPMLKGSKVHAGAVKVTLDKLTYDGVTNTASDFIRGGAKVTFPTLLPKVKNGKQLHIVFGMYMIDYKGGDGAIRSSDDEVILLNSLDSEGKAGGVGTGRWYTMGRGESRCNADWVSVEITGEQIYAGADEMVGGISMRSFRDDDFYIDYISYYYA